MTATTITTAQADMLRTAVLAKIAYWDALRVIEIELGDNLTTAQDNALYNAVDGLATSVNTAADISHENAQEVFDHVRSA